MAEGISIKHKGKGGGKGMVQACLKLNQPPPPESAVSCFRPRILDLRGGGGRGGGESPGWAIHDLTSRKIPHAYILRLTGGSPEFGVHFTPFPSFLV